MASDEPGLLACIAQAQAEIGSLAYDSHARITLKTGGAYEYDYLSEGYIMAKVREILNPLGVAVFVSTTNAAPVQGGYFVTIEITFAKGLDQVTIKGGGLGLDDRDKAYNKALTSAVRTCLTKTFLQGGDIDPEQTVNERTRPLPAGPVKLSDSQLKRLTQKAVDSRITTPDGAVDQKLLCRIASYVGGVKVTRMDEISGTAFAKLVEGINGKPPALDGYAANPDAGLDRVLELEAKNGW